MFCPLELEDSGQYQCIAENKKGTDTFYSTILVAPVQKITALKFIKRLIATCIPAGTPATFLCVVEGSLPVSFIWKKDGK